MHSVIEKTVTEIGRALLGKETQIRLALCCLLARGHLLIEDLPGMGKTTLSHAMARVLGLHFNRIQFTSDLLPADILGVSVFEQSSGQFIFHEGPIFTQILLADEINRTTPKSQSALLEAMAEGQVTIEGQTRPLPDTFFVLATQNPVTQSGTFPLPESQLDRFLMRLQLGYPEPAAERAMLEGKNVSGSLAELSQVMTEQQLHALQQELLAVKASSALLDYIQRLVAHTRSAAEFSYGLSPRAALALLACAKGWALIAGRQHVIPEDVQTVLPAVAAHRLSASADFNGDGSALVDRLLNEVDAL